MTLRPSKLSSHQNLIMAALMRVPVMVGYALWGISIGIKGGWYDWPLCFGGLLMGIAGVFAMEMYFRVGYKKQQRPEVIVQGEILVQ